MITPNTPLDLSSRALLPIPTCGAFVGYFIFRKPDERAVHALTGRKITFYKFKSEDSVFLIVANKGIGLLRRRGYHVDVLQRLTDEEIHNTVKMD